MRMLVFFDLPTQTNEDKKEYRKFRKLLISNGFIMLQESVYCRMVLNKTVEKSVSEVLRRNKPADGVVMLLCVTEKQFSGIEYIVGNFKTDVITSDERVIFL